MDERNIWVKKFEENLPDTEEVKQLNEESQILKKQYDTMPEGMEKVEVGRRMQKIAVRLNQLSQAQKKSAEDKTVEDLLKEHPENVIELK
jgi:hypothetical protein